MAFQIAALLILAAFYGCYFLKMISQGKKGIQTDQMGKGKTGFVKFIEVTLKTVTCLVPLGEILAIALNRTALPDAVRWTGALVAALGVAVFLCAMVHMGESWRAGVSRTDKTRLVTGGIYRISRNPAFLGFDLVYLGILLMFFSWPLFALSALAGLMLHLQIVNVEEDFLVVTFGDAYLDYRKRVNRYLGRKIL